MQVSRFSVGLVAGVLVAASAAGQASAQGKSDSATTTVTANVPSLVRISKLDDITFDNVQFTGNETQSDEVCVWTNTANDYQLTVNSDNGGYTLTSSETADTIAYDVAWAADKSVSQFTGATPVDDGAQNSFNSSYTNPACQGDTNAELFIRLQTPETTDPVAAGSYTDTLTLNVEPL
jgi:hypothetical protein